MKQFLLPALLFLAGFAHSQTASETLRYSYLQQSGTARYLGAGGAFGALGADFGTLSQNPAGLALFRSDELMITPALKFANTTATLPGNQGWDESKSNFHLDNAGIVFNTNPAGGRWTTFNVGLGFNRQNNFNQSIFYEGNQGGTILNDFYNSAVNDFNATGQVDNFDPFGAQLAYDVFAIYDPVINPGESVDELSYDFLNTPNAVINPPNRSRPRAA